MNIQLKPVTEENFWAILNMKSDKEQEKKIQIFERWVGSNTFFIALASVQGWVNRAIYDGDTLIGFATHGLDKENNRYEMVSIMLGYQYQGKGYGVASLKAVLDDMFRHYNCNEIYLTVIPENEAAIRTYKKLGFKPTGEIVKAFHDEHVYCLKV
ncbi:GNAT family N-acetyltransferase [Bacillus timonensis]|nr:GNAT family N-acetyltransferase [Bacillus timonensis]